MSCEIWTPQVGDLVIVYTMRDYGMHGEVIGMWGRSATVRLVNGQITTCGVYDLSPR